MHPSNWILLVVGLIAGVNGFIVARNAPPFSGQPRFCFTNPIRVVVGLPPRVGLFGGPAKPGQCNVPPAAPPRPPVAAAPATKTVTTTAPGKTITVLGPTTTVLGPRTTVLGPTTTVTGPTATVLGPTTTVLGPTTTVTGPTISIPGPTLTACTSTLSDCTSTTTRFSIDPVSMAAGSAVCNGRYPGARPTPLYNSLGAPACCRPLYQLSTQPGGAVVTEASC